MTENDDRSMTDLNVLFLQNVREGDLSAIIRCLDQGAEIHTKEDKALIIAANKGYLSIVRLLLDRGADIHANEDLALRNAAYRGHLEVTLLLLDRGADIHARDDHALLRSAWKRKTEVVRLLLDRGADIHAEEDEALQGAARQGHLDLMLLLLDRGADIHAGGGEVLRSAVLGGHIEAVSLLLDRGANINYGEYSAFNYALYRGHLEIVRLLLDRGANPRNILAKKMDKTIKRTIISRSRHRPKIDQETLISFLDDPPLFHASMTLRYLLLPAVKAYLYSPWSRSNTENLELLHLEGDEESNRRSLRRHRDTLISQAVDNPRWTHDYLLHNFSSVPWGDDSRGLRSLIGDGNPRPSRRQLICRLPTSILEELTS